MDFVINFKRLFVILLVWLTAVSTLLFFGRTLVSADIAAPELNICFATYGDFTQTEGSPDNSALHDVIDAAAPGDVVKVAGECTSFGANPTTLITKSITLQGGHTESNWMLPPDMATYPTYLDANNFGRVVMISGTNVVTISNLILQNGSVSGTENGGGLYNEDSIVTISNTIVLSNTASDGGGIYNDTGTIHLNSSVIRNNRANALSSSESRGGGGIHNDNGILIIHDSQIINNVTGRNGGGIVNHGEFMTITQSLIANNSGVNPDSRIAHRVAVPQNFSNSGGGIANFYADVWIENSTIRDNRIYGIGGGGLSHTGGGSYVTVVNSTIEGNTANNGQGGGILYSEDITLTNSTVSGNHADVGGGLHQSDFEQATAVIQYSTIASNTASINGHNIGMAQSSSIIELTSSIVAGTGSNCNIGEGLLIDHGYNLESDNSCGLTMTTSLTNTNPLLQLLADNGGGTETHAISADSPANNHIDDGMNGCGVTITTDQRGVTRSSFGHCDIGAYELEAYFIYLPIILMQ